VRLQVVVLVEFAVMVLGAEGQMTVNPLGEDVPDREIVPAKLLMLVRETEMDPAPPKLMFVGLTLREKSPTCTIDPTPWEEVPGAPFPVIMI
jgi:hypothetical protein